jgi:hypothetical protein
MFDKQVRFLHTISSKEAVKSHSSFVGIREHCSVKTRAAQKRKL